MSGRKIPHHHGRSTIAIPLETRRITEAPDAIAPDGLEVRVLGSLARGALAEFRLAPFATGRAVAHRTIEEIWVFTSGKGRLWRKRAEMEEVTEVRPGVAIVIPAGTHFQLRSESAEPLIAIAATMPPWPGDGEADPVAGVWAPTV